MKNINTEFVAKSFKPGRIKDEKKRKEALINTQNITDEYMKKFYINKPLYKIMINFIALNQINSELQKYNDLVFLLDNIPQFVLSNHKIFIDAKFIEFLKEKHTDIYNSVSIDLQQLDKHRNLIYLNSKSVFRRQVKLRNHSTIFRSSLRFNIWCVHYSRAG